MGKYCEHVLVMERELKDRIDAKLGEPCQKVEYKGRVIKFHITMPSGRIKTLSIKENSSACPWCGKKLKRKKEVRDGNKAGRARKRTERDGGKEALQGADG